MPWSWAALMPHPPILVPEIGCGREREAAATSDGVEKAAKKLAELRPDCLLFLSPHQPYAWEALFVNAAPHLKGSFAPFGASSISFTLETAMERLRLMADHLTWSGVPVRAGESPDLTRDQGTLVPLYFLRRVWPGGQSGEIPPVVLASPIGLEPAAAFKLGEALASFDDSARWGLLASGDLSHRLTPSAPSGCNPAGKKFDAAVAEALSSGGPEPLLALSPEEVEAAGECGLRSVMAMLGLCRALGKRIDVLSYEGPFGVGYCNAVSVF
jgi:aromatic ring-opening dioxygenase LigB subunit